MPSPRPDHTPMDQEPRSSASTALKQTKDPAHAKKQARARFNDEEIDSISASPKYHNSTAEMTDDSAHRARRRGLRPSIEIDDDLDMAQREVNRASTRTRSRPRARELWSRTAFEESSRADPCLPICTGQICDGRRRRRVFHTQRSTRRWGTLVC